MRKKQIISYILSFLLLINFLPNIFIDTADATALTMTLGEIGSQKEHRNIAWAYPEQYRSVQYPTSRIIYTNFNGQWIYGDGATSGFKIANTMNDIPLTAKWAFPRYLTYQGDTFTAKIDNGTSVQYYTRNGEAVTRQDAHIRQLPTNTVSRSTTTIENIPSNAIYVIPPVYEYINRTITFYNTLIYGYHDTLDVFERTYSIEHDWITSDYTWLLTSNLIYDNAGNTLEFRTTVEPNDRIRYRHKETPLVDKPRNSPLSNSNYFVSPIGNRDAVAQGEIIHRGQTNVTQHGHVWSTSPNPTISVATKTQLGARNSGTFISNMTGLNPNTTYYVRAYATNAYGTVYGPQESFTTLPTSIKGYKYTYIGQMQNFTIPSGLTELTITTKGASSAPSIYYTGEQTHHFVTNPGPPAFGGIMKAKMTPIAGQVLNINVGGMDGYNGGGIVSKSDSISEENLSIGNIPYNLPNFIKREIGKFRKNLVQYTNSIERIYGTLGGGATDIRLNGTSLENRIMVVGGGGAGENYVKTTPLSGNYGKGGYGAGIPGEKGGDAPNLGSSTGGKGGTLIAGGLGSTSGAFVGQQGKLGQGGHTNALFSGGGGYYGGGGGVTSGQYANYHSGAGGGSAYKAPNLTFLEGQNGGHYGHGEVIIEFPNRPPVISNLQPSNNTSMHISNNINITWNDSDPDGDPLQRTIRIETTDGELIYNGAPTGQNNHSFNAINLINLNWNGNRYERTIRVTVTVDDLFGGVTQATSQITLYNFKPNVTISNPALATNVNDIFTLSGKAWDSNQDSLIITATIDGKTKTQTIPNAPSSTPSNDNWSFTWTDLGEGNYNNIKVVVTDDKGGREEIVWGGTLTIKDVLKIIDNAIQQNILPNADNKTRVVIGNTNAQISENPKNNETIVSIKNNVSNRGSEMFFVGQGGATKNYIQNALTNHYGTHGSSYVDDVINLILSMNNTAHSNVFVVGDFVNMDMLFIDTEKDYADIFIEDKLKTNEELQQLEETLETIIMKAKPGTLQAKYLHEPEIFDNPALIHSKSGEEWRVIQGIEDHFIINRAESNMRGEWTLTMKGSDDTGVPLFDKYSNEETITFIIHEKPKALISYWEDTNNFYLSGENSYDIDFEFSLPDKGIIRYQWHYQLENGNWYNYSQEGKRITMPKVIGGNLVKGYGLTVWDFHGATDITRETNLIEPELRAKLHPELTRFNLNTPGIPASEEIKVIDIETIPFASDRIEFALYQGGSRRTPLRTLNNPADLLISDVTYHQWRDIRNYQIPQTLPDGIYTARITALKADLSLSLTKEWSVRVNTPINLEPTMPSSVQAGEVYEITATTSKYANNVTVDIFNDGNIRNMQLINQANDIKYWRLSFTAPFVEPKVYTARFRATTPNGNEEIKTRNFTLQTLDLKNLRITNMVNHIEYEDQYPILYNDPKVPVNYKAGYYVTFKINAVGSPDNVRMRITYPGYNQEFDMVKESENGLDSVWKLEWYSDPFVPKGTTINTNVSARKNATTINFNDKYSWDGNYLRISGSIEGDWRIDQEL